MRTLRLFGLCCIVTSAATAAAACGEDAAPITPDTATDGGGPSSKPDGSSSNPDDDDAGTDGSVTPPKDGGPVSCTGEYVEPDLEGPGPCGTNDFGAPAAAFGPVDEDAGTAYQGTNLAEGIYDAVQAERLSGGGGSFRETFVVKGNRFTRIRQIDTGSGSGPGPVSYRAGTFTYVQGDGGGPIIQLSFDCSQIGDASTGNGQDNFPSDAVVTDDCNARYRYGAAGIRVTLRRRR